MKKRRGETRSQRAQHRNELRQHHSELQRKRNELYRQHNMHVQRRPHGLAKKLLGSFLLVLVMSVVLGLGAYWSIGRLAEWTNRAPGVGLVLLGSALWYFFVILLVWLPFHFWRLRVTPEQMQKDRGPFYNSLIDALDNIADGNFDVLVDIGTTTDFGYFSEIAAKVNRMAGELANMENARQEFVASVSHEIQSPLTSIGGFAALLKNPGLDEAQRLHYLEIIEAETDRLSKLSDSLLKLSMLDSESSEGLQKAPYRVDKQLGDVLLLLEPQWAAAGLEVALEAQEATLCADAEMLEQVWINLVHNAIKFTPAGGAITVRLRLEEGCLLCEVEDTGCGMPEEVRVHVFERFYKGDKARERARGGNGLGLSLVHKIVSLHGGTVAVQSRQEKGSVFTVLLPLE